MQKTADVLVLSVLVVMLVIGSCFAVTGACLVATDQNCRDNVAGKLVYKLARPFVSVRPEPFYLQSADTVLSAEAQQI